MTLKQCTKCGEWKMPHMFSNKKDGRDGLNSWCKECCNKYAKQHRKENPDYDKRYYKENREKRLAYTKHWQKENPERAKEIARRIREENPEYFKQYRKENSEKRLEYNRHWRKENIEKARETAQRWNKNNPDKIKEKARRWYEKNPDYHRQWCEKNPEKVREKDRKRRSHEAGLPFDFNGEDEANALEYFNYHCVFCGCAFEDMKHISFDHWIPLSDKHADNPGTVPTNMLPVCHGKGGCNNSKNDSDPEEWVIRTFGETEGQKIIDRIHTFFEWVDNNG